MMTAESPDNSVQRRPQQQDQNRLQQRHAIEDYARQRQLGRELADNPELVKADYLIAAHGVFR
jgi:hypothetical protein